MMHPLFVTLFIETDADDLLAEEQDRKRQAHAGRRGRSPREMSSGMSSFPLADPARRPPD